MGKRGEREMKESWIAEERKEGNGEKGETNMEVEGQGREGKEVGKEVGGEGKRGERRKGEEGMMNKEE